MPSRLAAAWVLVVVVALLLGLLLVVVAAGVSRHLRRQREIRRPLSKSITHRGSGEEYEADSPSEFPRHRPGDRADPDVE